MHNQRTAILVASITGVISTFLPFVKSWVKTQSLMSSGDPIGYVVLIGFFISLVLSITGERERPITGPHLAGAIIPGIIPGILLILMLIGHKTDDFSSFALSFEIGFYLILISSAIIIILGLALKEDAHLKPNFKKLEKDPSFCTNCGGEVVDSDTVFCEKCGNKLTDDNLAKDDYNPLPSPNYDQLLKTLANVKEHHAPILIKDVLSGQTRYVSKAELETMLKKDVNLRIEILET